MFRRVRENKLEGEKWDVESERLGNGKWEVKIEKDKKGGKRKWEWERRERDWVVGASNVSGEGKVMGIGGGTWEGGERILEWGVGLGRGLNVSRG